MKKLKKVKILRGRQNKDHETQSSSLFITWSRLHNVQPNKASYHTEISVKYCFKTNYRNARIHNAKKHHLKPLRSLVHNGIYRT